MFEKMTEALLSFKRLAEEQVKQSNMHYVKRFNDPIAGKTNWNALGDSEYHSLKKDVRGNIFFRPTILSHLFPGIFFLAGLFVLCSPLFFLFEFMQKSQLGFFESLIEMAHSSPEKLIVLPLFGLSFWIPPFFIFRKMWAPVVFNFQKGYFYKGHLKAHEHPQNKDSMPWCSLEEIYALQLLLREDSDPEGGTTISYEISIVKKDASRIGVVRYRKLKKSQEEGLILAQLLNVPLWDGVTNAYEG